MGRFRFTIKNAVYIFKRVLDKLLDRTSLHSALTSAVFFRGVPYNAGRDESDCAADALIRKLFLERDKLPSVCAVYRVKNASVLLELSVCSILPLCKEIVIVDNGSDDNTYSLALELSIKYKDKVNIKVYQYNSQLALAGPEYLTQLEGGGKKSLAEYYNYCFGLATTEYLVKVDAHVIYTLTGIEKIQRVIADEVDIIYYRGMEILGKCLSVEPYLFKNDSGFEYYDGTFYELLRFNSKRLVKNFVFQPTFLHVKRVIYSKYAAVGVSSIKELYKL